MSVVNEGKRRARVAKDQRIQVVNDLKKLTELIRRKSPSTEMAEEAVRWELALSKREEELNGA